MAHGTRWQGPLLASDRTLGTGNLPTNLGIPIEVARLFSGQYLFMEDFHCPDAVSNADADVITTRTWVPSLIGAAGATYGFTRVTATTVNSVSVNSTWGLMNLAAGGTDSTGLQVTPNLTQFNGEAGATDVAASYLANPMSFLVGLGSTAAAGEGLVHTFGARALFTSTGGAGGAGGSLFIGLAGGTADVLAGAGTFVASTNHIGFRTDASRNLFRGEAGTGAGVNADTGIDLTYGVWYDYLIVWDRRITVTAANSPMSFFVKRSNTRAWTHAGTTTTASAANRPASTIVLRPCFAAVNGVGDDVTLTFDWTFLATSATTRGTAL